MERFPKWMNIHNVPYSKRGYIEKWWNKPKRGRPKPRGTGYYGRFRRQANVGSRELKFHDIPLDDAVIAVGGTITPTINIIPQGVTEVQRIGRRCTIKHIAWRWTIKLANAVSLNQVDTVRMIMYLDKQANGAAATATDILELDDFQSFNNLANKGRFRILMDRTYSLNPTAGAGNGTTNDSFSFEMHGSFYKKCNIPLEFDGSTGALTETRSNTIGVMLMSSEGNCVFVSQIRLRFSDY